jgi:hypothetical protein
MEETGGVTIAEFEAQAAATDQNPDDSETPLLGLVGEVGSLLSAFKKKASRYRCFLRLSRGSRRGAR